jgi:hypothetical protein
MLCLTQLLSKDLPNIILQNVEIIATYSENLCQAYIFYVNRHLLSHNASNGKSRNNESRVVPLAGDADKGTGDINCIESLWGKPTKTTSVTYDIPHQCYWRLGWWNYLVSACLSFTLHLIHFFKTVTQYFRVFWPEYEWEMSVGW